MKSFSELMNLEFDTDIQADWLEVIPQLNEREYILARIKLFSSATLSIREALRSSPFNSNDVVIKAVQDSTQVTSDGWFNNYSSWVALANFMFSDKSIEYTKDTRRALPAFLLYFAESNPRKAWDCVGVSILSLTELMIALSIKDKIYQVSYTNYIDELGKDRHFSRLVVR
jgi:hypothetical protein